MEHFTNNADKDIDTKIREKRFKTMTKAATYANDRELAVRGSGSKQIGAAQYSRGKTADVAAFANKSATRGERQ